MKPLSWRIFLPCFGLLLLTACHKGKPGGNGSKKTPPGVEVIIVHPRNIPLTKNLVGQLSPYRSADVRARVAGVLLKRAYTEGSQVKKGQLLFQIDPVPLKTALHAAQAALTQAQTAYTNARINAQRAQKLAPMGYISGSDLDNTLATERSAAAAVQIARAKVENARIQLGYARVASPIAGRAGEQEVTEGALVGYDNKATLLTTVEQIDPLYLDFSLNVSELERMKQAQRQGYLHLMGHGKARVDITLPDGTPYRRRGVLDFSAAKVNPATGTIGLRAKVPNPHHQLLPGMYVTIKAYLGIRRGVFIIPHTALLRDAQGAYVLAVDRQNRATRHKVASAIMHGSDWIIHSDLNDGAKIIVSGLQKARAGMHVIPISRQAPPRRASTSTPHGK